MTEKLLTKPFAALVESECERHDDWLPREYGKVKRVLKNFAEHKEVPFSQLVLLDVCDDRNVGEISSGLRAFIDRSKKSANYRHEVGSRLRRILKLFSPAKSEGEGAPEGKAAAPQVPDFLKEALPYLPRQCSNGGAGLSPILSADHAKRMEQPLTETGQELFSALVRVAEEYGVVDLASLFMEHRKHVYEMIRRTLPCKRWQAVYCALYSLRTKLGFHESIIVQQSVAYEDWPAELKAQFGRLKELAREGIKNDSKLTKLAAESGVTVIPLEESTVGLYENSISYALFHVLPHLNDRAKKKLDVRDFLRLRKHKYVWEDAPKESFLNRLVEIYREHEKRKSTKDKGERFDSSQFLHFIHAIKAVAAYNGFFRLHKEFGDNYTINIDHQRRRDNKRIEKEVFDLDWVDKEIGRMLPIFNKIVRTRAYEFESKKGFSYHEAQRNMRFCLFFVLLVVLRYMGHRQQQIRNCVVNKNIFFLPDKSIFFNWKDYLIKNDVEIEQLLTQEYETHKLLVEVLSKYYHQIYLPYIVNHPVTDSDGVSLLGGQLFVCIDHRCKFRPFDPKGHRDFYSKFQSWSLEFMEFGDRAKKLGKGLHPHFFRGLAVDWLVNKKKVPLQKAAEYFGISVKTLIKHYLQESLKKSSTPALESANAEGVNTRIKEELKKTKAELARKDALLEEQRNRVYELQNELITVYKQTSNTQIGAQST